MKHTPTYFAYSFKAIFALILLTQTAHANELPPELRQSLDNAIETGDSYVHGAVMEYAVQQYGDMESSIRDYVKQRLVAIAEAKKAKEEKKKSAISGNISAGINYASGNVERENTKLGATLNYQKNAWKNVFKVNVTAGKEEDERTAEEYKVKNHTRYTLSDVNYVSMDLEYVNDRFSGQERRTTETLGFGHYFIKNPTFSLSGQVDVGARQSNYTDDTEENGLVQKLGSDLEWQINDYISFTEQASIVFGEDTTVTESDTAIKTKLTESMALLFQVNIEHLSDVPVGNENMDTLTSLNVLYDF